MRAPSRWIGPLAAALLVSGLTVACGDSTPSRAAVIARGNAICARTMTRLRATPPPLQAPAELTSMSHYLARIVPIVEHEAADLRELPRPAGGQHVLDAYIRAVGRTAAEYRTLAHAAASGNQTLVDATLTQLSTSSASSLAAAAGLSTCATASGAALS